MRIIARQLRAAHCTIFGCIRRGCVCSRVLVCRVILWKSCPLGWLVVGAFSWAPGRGPAPIMPNERRPRGYGAFVNGCSSFRDQGCSCRAPFHPVFRHFS